MCEDRQRSEVGIRVVRYSRAARHFATALRTLLLPARPVAHEREKRHDPHNDQPAVRITWVRAVKKIDFGLQINSLLRASGDVWPHLGAQGAECGHRAFMPLPTTSFTPA